MSLKRPRPEGELRGPRIDDVWLYVAIDADGREGVIACLDLKNNINMPMMATDESRVEALRPAATAAAKRLGSRLTLVRFHMRHDVEVILP